MYAGRLNLIKRNLPPYRKRNVHSICQIRVYSKNDYNTHLYIYIYILGIPALKKYINSNLKLNTHLNNTYMREKKKRDIIKI